jgi:hypothetical protein
MYLYIDDEKLDSNVFKETYGISEIERVVHFPDFPSHKDSFTPILTTILCNRTLNLFYQPSHASQTTQVKRLVRKSLTPIEIKTYR